MNKFIPAWNVCEWLKFLLHIGFQQRDVGVGFQTGSRNIVVSLVQWKICIISLIYGQIAEILCLKEIGFKEVDGDMRCRHGHSVVYLVLYCIVCTDLRLKFMTVLMLIVLAVSVTITVMRFGLSPLWADHFVPELSTHYHTSAMFAAFYGLLNFYVFTMAFVYSPSRNAVFGQLSLTPSCLYAVFLWHELKYLTSKVSRLWSLLWEITLHVGSHSVTCHTAAVTFPHLPKPKLVLDLATPEGC